MKKASKLWLAALTIFTLMLCATPAEAQSSRYDRLDGVELRVLLTGSSSAKAYTITINGDYSIVDADDPDDVYAEIDSGTVTFYAYGSNDYSCEVDGEEYDSSSPFMAVPYNVDDYFTYNGTSYRGCFKAMHSGSYYYAINQINIELYLYGVVGRELGYGYNDDATMAQAVAARSYALSSYSSKNVYYDLTNTTSSQVYGGKSAETQKIIDAVDETCGMILEYRGDVVQTYYSSNMGGHTENIENVWVSDDVPITGVPSPHDALAGNYSSYGASTYSWVVEYTPSELVALANSYGKTDIGTYKGISYSTTLNGKTSVSGRAMTVTISGSKGSVTATKDSIRSLLNLKSTLITISDNSSGSSAAYIKGADGQAISFSTLNDVYAVGSSGGTMKANGSNSSLYVVGSSGVAAELDKTAGTGDTIVINGRGYGHGVGLSQFGAIAMGDDGYTWDEIIEHYFCTNNGIELVEAY